MGSRRPDDRIKPSVMSAYPYFSAALPQWKFSAEGEGPSVEAICAEAKELLSRKDLAVLAYMFSPAYHKLWMEKVRAEACLPEDTASNGTRPAQMASQTATPAAAETDPGIAGFEPACLVTEIENLPYMQAFRAAYSRQCVAAAARQVAGTETASSVLNVAEVQADEASEAEIWSETEAYRRLQAMFYAEVPRLSSAFLRAYYRFDWEWKAAESRINRKKYPEASMDDALPAYPAKGDRAAADAEWVQALDKEPLTQIWDYAEDMEKVEAEPDLMKREWLCDTFRWRYAEAWGGDATASTDYLWAYFIRLQLQWRWQRLGKADGRQMLKGKLQSLRAVDWEKNEFSATTGA